MRAYKKRSRVFRPVLLQTDRLWFQLYICKYPAMVEAEIVMSKIMQTCLYICSFTLIIFRFLMCPTYGPQAVDKRSTLLPTAQLYCMTVVCLQKQNVSFNFVHIQPRKTNTAVCTHTHTKTAWNGKNSFLPFLVVEGCEAAVTLSVLTQQCVYWRVALLWSCCPGAWGQDRSAEVCRFSFYGRACVFPSQLNCILVLIFLWRTQPVNQRHLVVASPSLY